MKRLSDYIISNSNVQTVGITKIISIDTTQQPNVIIGVKATSYNAGVGSWQFGNDTIVFNSYQVEPISNCVYAFIGNSLIGDVIANETKIVISGTSNSSINGVYYPINNTDVGISRVFYNPAGGKYLFYTSEQLKWVIYDSVDRYRIGYEYVAISQQSTNDPWTLTWNTWDYGTPTVTTVENESNSVATKGLIRYAALSSASTSDEFGNQLSFTSSDIGYQVSSQLKDVNNNFATVLNCTQYGHIEYQQGISGLTSFTISFWTKPTTGSWTYLTFSGATQQSQWLNASTGCQIWIGIHDDTDYIAVTDGSDQQSGTIVGVQNVVKGWKHIAVVWSGKSFKLYINGVQQGSESNSEINFANKACYLSVNNIHRAPNVVAANGKYAKLRMYNKALSTAQISTLANEFTIVNG